MTRRDGESHEGKQTTVEEGTRFKGAFASDCPIVVRGRIEGEISGPSLTVSATGSVSGTVKVKELRSEGELSGEYDAEVVRLSGTVKDNTVIRARSLEVSLSPERGRMQVVFGECELEVGDVPQKEAAVSAASYVPPPPMVADDPSTSNGPRTDPPPPMVASEGEAEAEAKPRVGRRKSTFPPDPGL